VPDLPALVNLLTIVTLVGSLLFAAFEWRRSRLERHRQSQVLLLRSFDSPEFAKAMRVVLDLPDDQSATQLEATLKKDGLDLLWYYLGVMESLGIMVFKREIDIHLVDQSMGGPIIITWQKLRRYAAESRRELSRDSMYEWYQWLAERLGALELREGRTAAYVREKDWRP
jgi:hypothetical protein